MNQEEQKNYREAGEIAREVVEYAREIIKKDTSLLEIAEKIESKIEKLGGKPAFPVNISINDTAAHNTPASDDETKAFGLLKIDLGVHVSGYIVDTAFSLDLEDNEENKKLILVAEKALEKAIKATKPGIEVWKIGEIIHNTITSQQISPIRNLSGHELDRYMIHAGLTIPNYNNNNKAKIEEGVYAIEPFSTLGQGVVYEGKNSGIYSLIEKKPIRNQQAREILEFIEKEYSTLPFCTRWLDKKFSNVTLPLKLLEQEGILKQYPQLIEKAHGKVAQAEHTILVAKNKIEVLT